MRHLLERVWDPDEFRSDYGLRSLSKFHEHHPFSFGEAQVGYEPAESVEMLKGGNSNWRGPIWFPTSFMMIESMRKLGKAYGPRFAVESPVEGEPAVTLNEMGRGFADRLIGIFTRDAGAAGPSTAGTASFRKTRTGATSSSSTSIFRATRAWGSALRTRPAGRASSPRSSTSGENEQYRERYRVGPGHIR